MLDMYMPYLPHKCFFFSLKFLLPGPEIMQLHHTYLFTVYVATTNHYSVLTYLPFQKMSEKFSFKKMMI